MVKKEESMLLENAFKEEIVPGTTNRADELFASFFGKELKDWRDPWNNKYMIKSSYDNDKRGFIVVFVSPGRHGDNTMTGPHEIGETPRDTFTKADGTAMYRIVYGVTY